MQFTPLGEPARTILRGGPGTMSEAARFSRMPGAHPEGYVEGFGNLYRDAAHLIAARRAGASPDPDPAIAAVVPTVGDGLAGLRFIEASVNSHEAGGGLDRHLNPSPTWRRPTPTTVKGRNAIAIGRRAFIIVAASIAGFAFGEGENGDSAGCEIPHRPV